MTAVEQVKLAEKLQPARLSLGEDADRHLEAGQTLELENAIAEGFA